MGSYPSLSLVAALLLVAGAEPASAKSDPAQSRLAAIEARVGGRLGVAALATGNGKRIEYRPSERFLMCSTFKLLAAAAVLHRVDQKQEQLDRFIPYTKADLLEYAPVTREHVEEGGMTLSALCAAAVTMSDNTAANLVLKTIEGPAGWTRYARSLGDKVSRLDRMEPELNNAEAGDDRDSTTAAAMLEDLRVLLLGEALSPASRAQLETWLRGNKTGDDLIRAGLPRHWVVGDKTGRSHLGATNDIAIIRPPGKAPILLAIYSSGSGASVEAHNTAIADVARLVAEIF
jgi:beta-lactamase class A